MTLCSEFSLLKVPLSVIRDDFNFKWSFPKLPVISNNHIYIKICVQQGMMNPDTSLLAVWLVKVQTCFYVRGEEGMRGTCIDLRRAGGLLWGKYV